MSLRLPTLLSVLFLLSVSLFLAPSLAYDVEEETGSLMLTELDFGSAIKEYDNVLVNFMALWCRYSKKLKPEWKKLADNLKADKSYAVTLAKVEAYDEKKLAEQYGVEGFPTIKMFIKGTPYDYNGERTQEALQEFVDRMTKRSLKTVDSVADVENYLKQYEWVGILAGSDSSAQSVVQDVAFKTGDVLFLTTTSDPVKSKYNIADGQFVLVNNISQDPAVDKDALTADSLTKFIETNKFPAVARFTKGTAERVFLSEDPSLLLITKGDSGTEVDAFKAANKQLAGKIFMSTVNYNDEIGKLLTENLGVAETDLPSVRIVRPDRERIRKYGLEGAITSDSIVGFYNDYTNKKAKRFYLSQAPPADDPNLVKTVVTSTFQNIVLDGNKDVLLHIWAPWCGHCRAMMPVYDNVARKTREVENFVVAKIDASVNDLEGFGLDIVEYPTILLFKRNDKSNPIEFKDERNEYKFNDFIRANAAVNLERMKGPNPFDKNEL